MSTVIEQKVVEMRFDNKQFETNVAQSMSTLDKLKEALSKSTSVNAFDGLSKAAGRVDLSGVSSSVQKVTDSFSVLEEIAIGALRRIGESIEEHLVRGLKNLTFGNVISGWERFAQKTESTQTILSAIANDDKYGEDKLSYVENLLEKLAWFSDETSYNFTDMTDNISKFTAAGMDLDKSTDAMMGIATWAAMSGQNAQVASRAMYQLSQAMGMGRINLIDWKSIEVANMATKEVKQMLMDYAYMSKSSGLKLDELGYYVEHVTNKGVERIAVDNGTFRDTLKYGWLTADAFSDAMNEYASYANALHEVIFNDENKGKGLYASELIRMLDNAQKKAEKTGQTIEEIMRNEYKVEVGDALEGVTELGIRAMKAAQQARTFQQAIDSVNDAASTKWATIFEKVIGNVDEATVFYTDLAEYLYDIFIEPLNGVIETLTEWKESGGRDLLLGFKDEEGETVNGAIQNIGEAISAVKEAIGSGIGLVFAPPTAEQLVDLTQRFKDFTEKLVISEDTAKGVKNVFFRVTSGFNSFARALSSVAGAVGRVFKGIYKSAKEIFGDSISALFHNVTQFFYNFGTSVRKVFENINMSESASKKFEKILEAIKVVINAISGAFQTINSKLADFVRGQHFQKVADFLGGKFLDILLWLPSKIADVIVWVDKFIRTDNKFSGFVSTLGKVFISIKDFIGGFVKAMLPAEGFPGLFDRIKTSFENLIEKIKESKVFSWLADALTDAYNAVKKFFKEGLNAEGGASAYEAISNALKKFGETVADVYKSVKDFFSNNIDFEKIGEALSTAGNAIANAFGSAYEALKNFFSLFKKNKQTTNDVAKTSSNISKVSNTSNNAFDSLEKASFDSTFDSDAARESLIEFAEKIPEVFKKAADATKDLAGGIESVGESVGEAAKKIDTSSFVQGIKEFGAAISAFFSDLFTGGDSLSSLSQNGAAKTSFGNAIETIFGVILKIGKYIAENLPALLTGGGLFALGAGLLEFSAGFKKVAKGLKVFLKNVGWGVEAWGKGEKFKGFGKMVLSLAGAIVIFLIGLAGAIYLLNGVLKDTTSERSLALITRSLFGLFIGLLALVALMDLGKWQDNASEAAKMASLALVLKSMATSVAIICLTVALMTKWVDKLQPEQMDSLKKTFGGILALLVVLGGMMALIAHAGKGGLALFGVLAMIVGVKLLIDTTIKLYEYITNNTIDAGSLFAVFVIIGVLIAILELMSDMASTGKRSAKAAIVMVVAAVVVAAMSLVLVELAKAVKIISWDNIFKALLIIGTLSLVVMGLSNIGDGNTAGNLAASALVLAVAAGSIVAMSFVFEKIADVVKTYGGEGTLIKALGIIAALGAVLVAMTMLAGKDNTIPELIASTIAMGVMAVVMWGMEEVLKKVVEIVALNPEEALWSAVGMAGTMAIMAGALYVLSKQALGVVGGALAMIALAYAMQIMGEVFATITDVVRSNSNGDLLKSALGMIGVLALMVIALAVLGAIGPVALVGAAALVILAVGISILIMNLQMIGPALVSLAAGFTEMCKIIEENKEPILGAIEVFWAAILLSIEGFFASIHLSIQTVISNLDEDIALIQASIHRFFSDLNTDIHEDIMDIIGNLDEDFNTIVDNVHSLAMKISDNIGGPNGLIQTILGHFKTNAIDFLTAGSDIVANVAEGIGQNKQRTHTAIRETTMENIEFWKTFIPDLFEALVDMIETIATSIDNNAPEFWDACAHLVKAIWNAIWYPFTGDGEYSLKNLGINIIKGLGQGLVDGVASVGSFLGNCVSSVVNFVKGKIIGEDGFDTHSPSKWAEGIGVYIDEGLAQGLLKGLSEPMGASELLTGNIMESLKGQFSDIESMFSNDLTPTITPVMDLTQVQNGMTSMDSMFGEYENFSLDSALNSSYSPFTDYTGELKVDNFQALFDKLGSFDLKLDDMLSKLTNLQVVLDSGELVGGLVGPMDDALGNRAIQAGRSVR